MVPVFVALQTRVMRRAITRKHLIDLPTPRWEIERICTLSFNSNHL